MYYLSWFIDWLQSLKQFLINVSYHILVASLTLMALFFKTEPSELDWLQVYDNSDTVMTIVLRTGASLHGIHRREKLHFNWLHNFKTASHAE